MDQVEWGDTITVYFTGMHRDGSVFSTADPEDPFTFTLGSGEVLPGFERAVVGMSPGDTKTIVIVPDRSLSADRKEITLEVEEETPTPEHDLDDVPQRMPTINDDLHSIAVDTSDRFEDNHEMEENIAALGEEVTYQITLVRIEKKSNKKQ
jgi:peptidylprolyl isomerase